MEMKKSLGQHFLRSSHYLRLIADTAEIKAGEMVVEIGPGDGALTLELLARGAKVLAIEKDRRLIPILKERFAGKNFDVVEEDALFFNPSRLKKYKLIGNIPYYITGALLKKFLSSKHQPSEIVFLVQKEVAQRIVSGNPDAKGSGPRPGRRGKESILSLSVKVYGEPRYIQTVPRGAFAPPPNVDSAILSIKNISRKNFTLSTSLRANSKFEKRFFELVRAGFAHKRKILSRNLEALLPHPDKLENAGILKNTRAEDVPLPKWLALTKP